MEITQEQYERIQDCLPVQRGNVRHYNLVLLNAILYVAEHGCKWRGLPKRYGNWHSIYVRMNRWAKKPLATKPPCRLPLDALETSSLSAMRLGLRSRSQTPGAKEKYGFTASKSRSFRGSLFPC